MKTDLISDIVRHPETGLVPDMRRDLYCRINAMLWEADLRSHEGHCAALSGRDSTALLDAARVLVEQAIGMGLTLHDVSIDEVYRRRRAGDRRSDLELLEDVEQAAIGSPYADIHLSATESLARIAIATMARPAVSA